MQKIRLQIMLGLEDLNRLHGYQLEHQLRNESEAVAEVLKARHRLQYIIDQLEKKAHEAEKWKERAEEKDGTVLKPTIVVDAKADTDSKQKSVGNIKDTRKPKGGC